MCTWHALIDSTVSVVCFSVILVLHDYFITRKKLTLKSNAVGKGKGGGVEKGEDRRRERKGKCENGRGEKGRASGRERKPDG